MDESRTPESDEAPLIGVAELAARLGRPDLAVLDIRSSGYGGGRAAFDAGHIPGAVHSDYVADGWRATKGAAVGLLPGPDHLRRLFERLGIEPGRHVVIVPAGLSYGDFSVAARIFWTFRQAGHRRLSILDGGFEAWLAAGAPVDDSEGGLPPAGTYLVRMATESRALLPQVETALGSGAAVLLDSRGPRSFSGEEKSAQAARAGRLPGAINVEGALAYDPAENRLRPRPELERLFAPVPDGEVIAYCNTGQAAATDWFVLSEILGRPGVSLYDGSMSEWTADASRPVETGPP